jgi:hypothetical protein
MIRRWLITAVALYCALTTQYSIPCHGQSAAKGPLAILQNFDIGPPQLESLTDNQPLSAAEQDLLVKLIYHVPRLGLDNLQRWRQQGTTWEQLAAAPAKHRLQVFHIAGRAKRVETAQLPAEQAELFQFDRYYRVRVALTGSQVEATIATRRVPAAWPLDAPLDEPTAADAIFLKALKPGEEPQLFLATERLGWYPEQPDEKHHIGASQLALSKHGMDISLWDDIRQAKDRGLGAADREGFYQLLYTIRNLTADDSPLTTHHSPPTGQQLADLLDQPQDHFGDEFHLEGLARRVMRVPVADADIRSRLDVDHYYEIDLFLPLGDAALRLGNDPKGEKNPVYRNKFPATLIVRDLPAGFPEGETIHELVAADGVFFKTWNYRSGYAGKFGQLQPAPLFIAATAKIVSTDVGPNWITSGLVIAALAIALGVVVLVGWVYRREDRSARKTGPAGASDQPRPDFSRLG